MTDISSSKQPSESNKQLRRLQLLKKSGIFDGLPEDLICKRATTAQEHREAFNLVYQSYIDNNYILPNKSEMRVRLWETFPQNGTFICKDSEKVVGVTGTVMDNTSLLLPSDHAFHDELNQMRDDGAVLCEISNQAVASEYRNTPVTTELMCAAFGHAWFSECTDLVCAVSPKQRNFFSLMGFEQVGDIKSYSDIVHDPVALLRMPHIQDRYSPGKPGDPTINEFWNRLFITGNPYIPVFPLWQRMVDMLFASPHAIQTMYEGCTELFEDLDANERRILEQNLGTSFRYILPEYAKENTIDI